MKHYFQDNGSDKLIVFFAGWGCDENQFVNLKDNDNVLILYDYQNLDLNFDFSKYQYIDVIAYSAGVFIASAWRPDFKISKKVAINGNPYLFDEKLGLKACLIDEFRAINLDNYLEFRRKYMVENEEEYQRYNQLQSLRSIESCMTELDALQKLYAEHKDNLLIDFDEVILSDNDVLFDFSVQKCFYKCPIKIVPDSKHHLFFKFSSFREMLG